MTSKNVFDAKMYLVFFYIVKKQSVDLTCKNTFLLVKSYKCIWCQNVFWQRVHFPLENVQHHIFQRKMLGLAPFFFALQKTLKKKDTKMYFGCAKIHFCITKEQKVMQRKQKVLSGLRTDKKESKQNKKQLPSILLRKMYYFKYLKYLKLYKNINKVWI